MVAEGITVGEAIDAYERHLIAKGLRARPITDRVYRLAAFFPDRALLLTDLTTAKCAAYYEALRGARTAWGGRTASTATAACWLKPGCWRSSPSASGGCGRARSSASRGWGRRKHGKASCGLTRPGAGWPWRSSRPTWGEGGAVAAMTALLLGMRASEIVSRVVRDLDDGGRLLWIPHSKTEAGRRTLQVPDQLRPFLQRLAAGRKSDDLLFGYHDWDWVRTWVQRIRTDAKVPVVGAHSMRGLHSTLAMAAGVTGHVVAASLGHEKIGTTIRSYADPAAVAGAQQRRTLKVLAGGAA